MSVLGIDTSNYTTSVALYQDDGRVIQRKKLLPVKEGTLGLRQSDAVFHHVRQLPELIEALFAEGDREISAIGVSTRPRDVDGSYMPCFLVGQACARQLGAVLGVSVHSFSHQAGHIMAALYSSGQMALRRENFLAFHVSGGTTEALLVEPDREKIVRARCVARTLDLNAGQAVDRVGGLLGLPFPAGPALEKLAQDCTEPLPVKAVMKDADCCLSGVENQCRALLKKETPAECIARFCLDTIQETLIQMTEVLKKKFGDLPLLYSGGVMANSLIRQAILEKYEAWFADPAFSADNAAGVAVLAALREKKEG